MSMERLSLATLGRLPTTVRRPGFDPRSLEVGIVHLGLGAFHRAHQALYTQEAIAVHPGAWGICGVIPRSPDVRPSLLPQDNLYTLVERTADGVTARIIGTEREVLYAPAEPEAVTARIAAPTTKVVTLTITEKGYCLDPASGRLNEAHSEIVHDLTDAGTPLTAIGQLARGLAARRQQHGGKLTILSCDNIMENGHAIDHALTRFLELADRELGRWVADNVTFPCSMVDRIVPAATEASLHQAEQQTGLRDEAAIVCESFRQWVIEDRFAAERPAWDAVGAMLVRDVVPYETMKLRLLNGSHSALAYLGYLSGDQTIAQAIGEPSLRALVARMMEDEVSPTLVVPAGVDLAAYRAQLLQRFADPGLAHRTWQIAMDGSQKLPPRLLAPIRSRLAKGQSFDCLALAVAGWMRYVIGVDESGNPIDVVDPQADRLRRIAGEVGRDAPALVERFGAITEIFGDLGRSPVFTAAVSGWLASLFALGVRATLAKAASETRHA
jgi:fructuronate reductase